MDFCFICKLIFLQRAKRHPSGGVGIGIAGVRLTLANNVTRFGEISPLWENFKSLCLFFEGLFCIGQSFETNWARFYDFGPVFFVVNGTILKR